MVFHIINTSAELYINKYQHKIQNTHRLLPAVRIISNKNFIYTYNLTNSIK